MKTTVLLFALMAITIVSFSQAKKDTAIKQSLKAEYKADPKRIYTLELTADQLSALMSASQDGVMPYLKKVKLTVDKLEEAQAYFNRMHGQLLNQYRKQYLSDSLKYVNVKIKSGK